MTAIFHDQSFVERNMREKKYFLLFNHRRMSTIILPSLQLLHIKIDDGNVRVYFYCQLLSSPDSIQWQCYKASAVENEKIFFIASRGFSEALKVFKGTTKSYKFKWIKLLKALLNLCHTQVPPQSPIPQAIFFLSPSQLIKIHHFLLSGTTTVKRRRFFVAW